MKRVLIVTYSFPPMLNMASMRMLRFVRELVSTGWDTDILTADEKRYSLKDGSLIRRVPAGARIFRESLELRSSDGPWSRKGAFGRREKRIPRPGSVAKKGFELMRKWMPSVNEPLAWRYGATKTGRQLVQAMGYSIIYSSSGPLACHSVAASLSRTAGLPWVAEFRDAILDSPYLQVPTRWHRRHFAARERAIVLGATAVIVTSTVHQNALRKRYGISVPIHVLPNGYDPSEYPAPVQHDRSKFVLTYAGSLYGPRSILPLLHGWREWLKRGAIAGRIPRLQIYGEAFNLDLAAIIRDYGLGDSVAFLGARGHEEIMAALSESDAVVVIKSPLDCIHIPGKLYESLGAAKPILLIGPESEASEIIRRAKAGAVVSTLDAGEVANALDRVGQFTAGKIVPPLEFAAGPLAAKLASIFSETMTTQRARGWGELRTADQGS